MIRQIEEHNKDKIMEDLSDFINKLINERNALSEQISNYNKDEQVAKLKRENECIKSNSLHILTKSEREQVELFKEEHWRNCKGSIKYLLEGTGLGTIVTVFCSKCGISEDITDIENW